MHPLELLVPAGNLEKLRTAFLYGADAVYIGAEGLSLRAGQAEFGPEEIKTGVDEAHRLGKRVYTAVNIFAQNRDLALVAEQLGLLASIGCDGVIVSDPGVIRIAQRVAPDLPLHLSTQANTTNVESVRFWRDQGVKRIIPARELSIAEIAAIAAAVPEIELELFVHGAMCLAYSGRCLLSAYRTGRSSNRGDCTHPCRWEHLLVESTRPYDPLVLEEDNRYSYILSSKDLCLMDRLPEMLGAGVKSCKIEGRMKSVYYIAVVTRTYRWALETLFKDPATYQTRPEWFAELSKISNRGYTHGFFDGVPENNMQNPEVKYFQSHDLAGTVLSYEREGRVLVGVRNRITREDSLELLLPETTIRLDSKQMVDEHGLPLDQAHNGYRVYLPVSEPVPAGTVIRKQLLES
ncbi:MAG TPA: U32 family peptidase [Bacillota bacterium]